MMKLSIFEDNKAPIEALEKWKVAYPKIDFVLTANDCCEIAFSYLKNKINSEQVTDWANFMELTDWVDYEAKNRTEIANFLFEISSPEINGEVSENLTLKTYEKFRELAESKKKGSD